MLAALQVTRLAYTVRPPSVGLSHGRARLAASVRCSSTTAGTTVIPGLASIVDKYDAVLLDQFGVLHDGQRALEGAEDCFKQLAAAGKKLVVLSNTSRRRDFAMRKLPGLGFDPEELLGFVCSGEEAWAAMGEMRGKRVLWISWSDDFQAWQPDYLDGLGLTLAPAAEADFVLCHGSMVLRDGSAEPAPTDLLESGVPSQQLLEALRECEARGLPMLCANPDIHVTLPTGQRGHMPGLVARLYEELGGAVTYYGKPHPPAFAACLELLGTEVDPSRVLMVGDSLAHDVAGANAAGIHSLFVTGGIHEEECGDLRPEALERAFDTHDARPTYTAGAFVW